MPKTKISFKVVVSPYYIDPLCPHMGMDGDSHEGPRLQRGFFHIVYLTRIPACRSCISRIPCWVLKVGFLPGRREFEVSYGFSWRTYRQTVWRNIFSHYCSSTNHAILAYCYSAENENVSPYSSALLDNHGRKPLLFITVQDK